MAGVREERVFEIVNDVRRLTRGLRIAATGTQSAAGISAAQLFVLRFLSDGEAHSIRDLAELTMTDRSSVAAVVDRLVTRGLAERAQSLDDRRRAEVRITSAGLYLVDAAPPAPTTQLLQALRALEDDDLRQLARGLSALISAMGLERSPAPMLFEDETQRRRHVDA